MKSLEPLSERTWWEGELAVVAPDGRARSDPEPRLQGPRTLPRVSLAPPQVWRLEELFAVEELPAGVRARVADRDYYIVRFACSFRARPDEPRVEWARFSVELAPGPDGRQPLAIDLHPTAVTTAVRRDVKFALKPTLKFAAVEISGAEAAVGLQYTALEPMVSAAGIGEATVSWDYQAVHGSPLSGPKEMHVVIEAPAGMPTGEATLGLAADLVHRGFRLAAAFRRRGVEDVEPLATRLWG